MLVKMINYTGRYMRSDEEKETAQSAILTSAEYFAGPHS